MVSIAHKPRDFAASPGLALVYAQAMSDKAKCRFPTLSEMYEQDALPTAYHSHFVISAAEGLLKHFVGSFDRTEAAAT